MAYLPRKQHPDPVLLGPQAGLNDVDLFMVQSVVTKKPDEESTQRRVIATVAAEWAKFAKNFNNKASKE